MIGNIFEVTGYREAVQKLAFVKRRSFQTIEYRFVRLCDAVSGMYGVNTGLAIKLEFCVASYVRTQALHMLICIIQQTLLFARS